jgi:hypothetical protein
MLYVLLDAKNLTFEESSKSSHCKAVAWSSSELRSIGRGGGEEEAGEQRIEKKR